MDPDGWIEAKREALGLLALHEAGDDEALVEANRDLLISKDADALERLVLQFVAISSTLLNELAQVKGICPGCLASNMALDAAGKD